MWPYCTAEEDGRFTVTFRLQSKESTNSRHFTLAKRLPPIRRRVVTVDATTGSRQDLRPRPGMRSLRLTWSALEQKTRRHRFLPVRKTVRSSPRHFAGESLQWQDSGLEPLSNTRTCAGKITLAGNEAEPTLE